MGEGSHGKLGPLSPFLPCSLLSIFFPSISQTSWLIQIDLTASGLRLRLPSEASSESFLKNLFTPMSYKDCMR